MPFSDHDESSGSRRRRGRGKQDDYEEFWTRELKATKRRRRRRGGDEDDGADDLTADLLGDDAPPPRRADPPSPPAPRRPAAPTVGGAGAGGARRSAGGPARPAPGAPAQPSTPPGAGRTPPRPVRQVRPIRPVGAQAAVPPSRRPGGPAGAATAGGALGGAAAAAARRPSGPPGGERGTTPPFRRPAPGSGGRDPVVGDRNGPLGAGDLRRPPGGGRPPGPGAVRDRGVGHPTGPLPRIGGPSVPRGGDAARPGAGVPRDRPYGGARAAGAAPPVGGRFGGGPQGEAPRRSHVDQPTQPVQVVFDAAGETPGVPPGDGGGGYGADTPYDEPTGYGPPASHDEPGDTRAWPDDAYGDDGYTDDVYGDEDGELDEDEDELPRRRGCRNALIVLAVLALVAMAAGWFAWSWVQRKIDPPGGPGEEVMVEIPEGASTTQIGEILADAGVISDARVWGWYTRLRGAPTIKAGSYRMRLNSSFGEALDDLSVDPLPPDSRLVTIPEGLTQAQIAERLADPEKGVPGFTVEGVQAAMQDPSVRSRYIPEGQPLLEGTLFPETYAVEDGDTELDVLRRMVDQFHQVAEEVQLEQRAAALGRTPYEVLIIASMVEREAGNVEEMPKIARVIYNRLEAGEPLGVDATSCYEKGEFPCQLTTAELEDNTPYDTRHQAGLPPTPIASPGRASIEAALGPAEGDWRWYVLDVTKDDGSHYFTNDYSDFLAARDRCKAAGRC